jgi:serine/threonine protein kinase
MIDRGSQEPDGSRAEELLELEAICSKFESEWSLDSISSIANLVLQADASLQNALATELTSIDIEMRQARHEHINTEEYLVRLPGLAVAVTNAIAETQKTKPSNDETRHDETRYDKSDIDVGDEDEFETVEIDSESQSLPNRIGDYQIVRRIGSGGVGVVYEGIQKSLGRRVAIKTLTQGHLSSHVSRFRREAKAIAMLHHTNIVKVFGSGIHEGTPYFAMQLIDGQNLADVIEAAQKNLSNSVGIQSQKEVAKIGVQVARALQHAHEQGVLHRDIKPSNLLLDENGTTWVTDFGLAKLADDKSRHAKTAGIVGTIRYIPPEGFSAQWDERSDVYSLGLTLYELITLRPVFEGDDFNQLVKTISDGSLSSNQTGKIEGGARDLETIIFKAVEREPSRRYSSAGELADELQRYLDGVPIKARPVSTMEKTLRWAKRNPAAAGLSALTLMVAFVGLPIVLWLWLQSSSALKTVEAQQQSIENARRDAEAASYSSTSLLVQSYIDRGLAQQASRALDGLVLDGDSASIKAKEESWEFRYLKQRLDTSQFTLQNESLLKKEYGVWQVVAGPNEQISTIHSLSPEQGVEGEVVIWDMKTRDPVHVLDDHGSSVFGCAYSNDGRRLATIGIELDNPESRGTICEWDVKTGIRISQISLPGKFGSETLSLYGFPALPGVAFSGDDELTVNWPNPVEVRKSQTDEVIWSCPGRYALVLPEDRVLIYTGVSVELRRLSSGEKLTDVKDQRLTNLSHFQLSSSGKRVSCIGIDRMFVWDSFEELNEFQIVAVPGIYWGVAYPEGTHMVSSARKGELTLKSLDQSNPDPPRSLLGHQGKVNHGCFSQGGNWLVTGGVDGTVKLWPMKPKQRVADSVLTHELLSNICFSSDGNRIHFVARRRDAGRYRHNAGTVDAKDMTFEGKRIETTYRAMWPRGDFSFSHDRKFLAAPVSEPGTPDEILGYAPVSKVGIWECDSWNRQRTVETGFSQIHAIQWNRIGDLIAVAGQTEGQHSVRIFNTQLEKPESVGELSVEESIVAIAFDESRLAVSAGDKISVFKLDHFTDRESPNSRIEFSKSFESKVRGRFVCLNFSPDGTRLATADLQHDNLNVFDVETERHLYQKSGPRAFCCVQFSPCGNRLALSGFDGIVYLCDAGSGYQLLQLSGPDPSPGTVAINSRVVFSPDGRRIATNNWQGKIRFWEVADGQVD